MWLDFALQHYSLLNQSRGDVIPNDVKYPINKLCKAKYGVGQDHLFAEDVLKIIKDMREQSKHMDAGVSYDSGRRYQMRHDYGYQCRRYGYGQHCKAASSGNTKYNKQTFNKFHRKNKPHKSGEQVCTKYECPELEIDSAHNVNSLLCLKNTLENCTGGKLSDNVNEWMNLTSVKWILETIHGYAIKFDKIPMYAECEQPKPIRMSKK
jgi:hypothetical protein